MSKNILKIVDDAMTALSINYGFGDYSADPITYPYFVGDYTEQEPMYEDGMTETTFYLRGFARGQNAALELENAKERIAKLFNRISGLSVMTADGSGVAIMYAGGNPVPTSDGEIKSIKINLSCKEWSVI